MVIDVKFFKRRTVGLRMALAGCEVKRGIKTKKGRMNRPSS